MFLLIFLFIKNSGKKKRGIFFNKKLSSTNVFNNSYVSIQTYELKLFRIGISHKTFANKSAFPSHVFKTTKPSCPWKLVQNIWRLLQSRKPVWLFFYYIIIHLRLLCINKCSDAILNSDAWCFGMQLCESELNEFLVSKRLFKIKIYTNLKRLNSVCMRLNSLHYRFIICCIFYLFRTDSK